MIIQLRPRPPLEAPADDKPLPPDGCKEDDDWEQAEAAALNAEDS